jgi:hypothetical protein
VKYENILDFSKRYLRMRIALIDVLVGVDNGFQRKKSVLYGVEFNFFSKLTI